MSKKNTSTEASLEQGEYTSKAEEKAAATKEAKVGKVVNIKKATKKMKKVSAGKTGKKTVSKRLSKSGNYKSVGDLAFSLFRKNANITQKEMTKIVSKEYPNSKFGNKGHFGWYKSKFNSTKTTSKKKVKKAA